MPASEWILDATRHLEPEEAEVVVGATRERAECSIKRGGLRAEALRLVLRFGLEVGLRATEMVSLVVADCDQRGLATARMLARYRKGGRSRAVAPRSGLAEHVRQYLADVPLRLVNDHDRATLLVGDGGNARTRRRLNGRMRTIHKRAGLSQEIACIPTWFRTGSFSCGAAYPAGNSRVSDPVREWKAQWLRRKRSWSSRGERGRIGMTSGGT